MQLWMWMRKIVEGSESRVNGVVEATGASYEHKAQDMIYA